MEPSVGGLDELWLRQVWFTRLRRLISPALVAMAFVIEHASGQRLFPRLPILALLATLLTLNAVYVMLLARFGAATAAHGRGLKLLAHAQVLLDLVTVALAAHFTGGPRSPFWPYLSLTVMAAALLFGRRGAIVGYTLAAVALSWLVCLVDGGGKLALQPMLLASFLSMVALICVYYAERMAESRQQASNKDEILSRVTHELRTPLSALRGFVYLAKKKQASQESSTPLGQTLSRIDAQVERLTRMVGDLYDVSAVQAGKLKLEPRSCDLIAVVREVALRFRTLHPQLELRWTGPEGMWGHWDALRLDQLLSNLIGNAVKYAGESSIVEVLVVPSSGGSAHIEVRDDGPGIPADKLAVIFEPFQRADPGTQKKGRGLGLAIAREIALQHGGAIWVDSQLGKGTTFHVRLPTGGARPPS